MGVGLFFGGAQFVVKMLAPYGHICDALAWRGEGRISFPSVLVWRLSYFVSNNMVPLGLSLASPLVLSLRRDMTLDSGPKASTPKSYNRLIVCFSLTGVSLRPFHLQLP